MSKNQPPGKVTAPGQIKKEDLTIKVKDLNFHINVGKPSDVDFNVVLQPLVDKLNKILEGVNHLMALSAESQALLAKLDAETTKISDKIDALLANPNTTEAEFRAALQPLADRLDVLGSDPANPVPPPLTV